MVLVGRGFWRVQVRWVVKVQLSFDELFFVFSLVVCDQVMTKNLSRLNL